MLTYVNLSDFIFQLELQFKNQPIFVICMRTLRDLLFYLLSMFCMDL